MEYYQRAIAEKDEMISNLESINFGNNQIVEIHPSLFNGLTNLEEIDFDNNQIKNISSYLFNGLSKLRKINFCNNF